MSPADRPRIVREVLALSERYLQERGVETARLDASLLLAHVLAVDRVQLYVDHSRPLVEVELGPFRELLRRRGAREPVAYLTGTREFWSLPFRVDSRVLIPRPDSETIPEEACALYRGMSGPARFADVGTGSGCLACALAHEFPQSSGIAIDSNEAALAVAGENVGRLGFSERIELRCGSLLEPSGGEGFDLICANLPYVRTSDLEALPPEINRFEPLAALDGGPDGLRLIRELIHEAPARLNAGGWLLLEVGDGQSEPVCGLLAQEGFHAVHTRDDLQKRPRVVVAKRGEM